MGVGLLGGAFLARLKRYREHAWCQSVIVLVNVQTIKSFEAPELGVAFTYFIPKQKNMAPKEVRHKGASPTEPAFQVSDNKMSIAVQSSGR
jgi:hypothetical protein